MAHTSVVRFYGGAGSVTGSNFMLEVSPSSQRATTIKILVDCGLFQGERSFETGNWDPFAYNPTEIDFLINTHVHIDHIGRIPKLVRDGYRGPILSTAASRELAEPLLLDALALNRHDALRLHKEPLYSEEDIAQAMKQWRGISYHEPQDMGDGVELQLLNSGHILGSAMARFTRSGRTIVFTGDLGGGNSPLLPLAEVPKDVQYLLIESVYGDKKRPDDANRQEALERIIEDATKDGGTLLIPAFSTERTQDLIYEIRELMLGKRIPDMPVYVDSPLAEKITEGYAHSPSYFNDDIRKRIEGGERIFSFPQMHFIENGKDSEELNQRPGQKIILAGSGMSNGGRVVGHEKTILPDEKSTLLIVGYQAAGSLGRRLVEGAKKVSIHGEEVLVRCQVKTMYGYSAHMDGEQLLEFVNKISDSPAGTAPLEQVFVVMGEPASASFLVQRVRDYLGLKATAPEVGQSVAINL